MKTYDLNDPRHRSNALDNIRTMAEQCRRWNFTRARARSFISREISHHLYSYAAANFSHLAPGEMLARLAPMEEEHARLIDEAFAAL